MYRIRDCVGCEVELPDSWRPAIVAVRPKLISDCACDFFLFLFV